MTGTTVCLEVPADVQAIRLDRFLSDRLPARTRSSLRRLIEQGHVLVEGRAAPKPGLALRPGMQVRVELPAPATRRPAAESIPLALAHEDEHLLVVVKPAGMVVHPGAGRSSGTLVNALLGRGTPLASVGAPDRPGIVHRLDRDTSGLLVVAKTDAAYHHLARALAARRVDKRYTALVWGRPEPSEGTIDRPIGRSRAHPVRMTTRGIRGRKRLALTHYRTTETLIGFALLDVELRTGRTHQIRVHFQSLHHPVVGDARYGGRQWRGVQDPPRRKALREFDRLALHASELAFDHPATGQRVRFHAPLPADFRQLLELLRGDR